VSGDLALRTSPARQALTREGVADAARALVNDGYELWLASNETVINTLELKPCGVPIAPLDFLGPYDHSWKLEDLMRVYNVLNATAFGPKGIPLPNWVMIDLGLLPSAFLLVTLPKERVVAEMTDARHSAADRERLGHVLPAVLAEAQRLHYDGPIPVAGYCAAPTPARGAWVGWSLCSAIPGLGTVAKGLALEAYRAKTLAGVAQFYDRALRVHRKFGPMEMVAAVLDLHPVKHTMAYRTQVFGSGTGGDHRGATRTLMLDARDLEAQSELQRRIDAGASRFFILSPGLVDDRVPILEIATDHAGT
jgi:hypothetical protein